MEKYIVIVNQKYLVSVEAGSHGGAEHRCLDLHYGIQTSQAFSRDDLRTECFRDMAIDCETISFAELAAKSEAFKVSIEKEREAREEIERNRKQLEELRREIAIIDGNNSFILHNIDQIINERESII